MRYFCDSAEITPMKNYSTLIDWQHVVSFSFHLRPLRHERANYGNHLDILQVKQWSFTLLLCLHAHCVRVPLLLYGGNTSWLVLRAPFKCNTILFTLLMSLLASYSVLRLGLDTRDVALARCHGVGHAYT